jgi:hypothetical protein
VVAVVQMQGIRLLTKLALVALAGAVVVAQDSFPPHQDHQIQAGEAVELKPHKELPILLAPVLAAPASSS